MSSEMRELIRKEVEQWVGITRNRDIERSARVWMEGYDAALTYCAERISALLARTEAGADGDKTGWQDGWPMAYHTRYRHVLEETIGQPFGEGTRLGSADIRRVAMAMAREFGVPTDTHPQDASGDAEWREFTRDDLPPATHQTFIAPRGLVWCWVGHEVIDIVNKHAAAMQAKEAK